MLSVSTVTPTVATLLQWCAENNIRIDPRLQVQFDETSGIAVFAKDEAIPPNTSLVFVHKDSVLSVRSCSLSSALDVVLSGPLAALSLSLALYAELLNGEESRWFGYLQSLPPKPVSLPIFWSQDCFNINNLNDGKEASRWLENTEIEAILASSNTLEDINAYYCTVAEPLLSRYFGGRPSLPVSKPELEGFYHAYSLVSSRAFLVDAYHGLSMVPIADAFNHTQDNHVHLETEFSVCAQCGSLYECPHDADDLNTPRPVDQRNTTHPTASEEFDSFYEMVSNASITPGEEVFNTYGETLTNAELLSRYGFILDVNENDRVSWDFGDMLSLFADRSGVEFAQTKAEWDMMVQKFGQEGVYSRISESSLIYYQVGNHGSALLLDADGRVSHGLWTLLALPLCLRVDRNNIEIPTSRAGIHLKALLEFQLTIEGVDETYHGGLNTHQLFEETTVLARLVMSLCAARKSRLGSQLPRNSGDLNDLLDNLPITKKCTRDAINLVMGEQSILDSCVAAWEELLLALQ